MFFKKKKALRERAEETKQATEQKTAEQDTELLLSVENFKRKQDLESAQTDAYLTLSKDLKADVFATAESGDGKQENIAPIRSFSIQLSNVPRTAGKNYYALTDYAKVTIRHQPLKAAYHNIVVYNNDMIDLDAIVSFVSYDDALKILATYGAGCVLHGEVDHIFKESIKPKAYYDERAIADGFAPFTDEEYEKICAAHKNSEYKAVRIRIID